MAQPRKRSRKKNLHRRSRQGRPGRPPTPPGLTLVEATHFCDLWKKNVVEAWIWKGNNYAPVFVGDLQAWALDKSAKRRWSHMARREDTQIVRGGILLLVDERK